MLIESFNPIVPEYNNTWDIKSSDIVGVIFSTEYRKDKIGYSLSFQMIYTCDIDEFNIFRYEDNHGCGIDIKQNNGSRASFPIDSTEYNSAITMAENFTGKSIDELSFGMLSYYS